MKTGKALIAAALLALMSVLAHAQDEACQVPSCQSAITASHLTQELPRKPAQKAAAMGCILILLSLASTMRNRARPAVKPRS